MRGRSEDVLDLSSFRQGMEKCCTDRVTGRAQRHSPQPVLHRGPLEPPGMPPTRAALGSGGQVERAREAVEEVATTAQHLDHAGRDRAIRGELARDEPMDARTRGEG